MNLQNIVNQFTSTTKNTASKAVNSNETGGLLSNITSQIPSGLAGGAAAGGVMALLMSNKKARKTMGKAASYGGAALLGGLAYKAFQNWNQNTQTAEHVTSDYKILATADPSESQHLTAHTTAEQQDFELTLMKAMIAAAKADGRIDPEEQQRIFQAVERMNLSANKKGMVFDCLQRDITIDELASAVDKIELKSEIYLASCLAMDLDHHLERAHLDQLGKALELPVDLQQQLELQAQQAFTSAA